MHSERSPWQHLLWVPPKVYSSVRFDFGTSRAEETSEILCQMTQCTLPRFVLLFVWGFGVFLSVCRWMERSILGPPSEAVPICKCRPTLSDHKGRIVAVKMGGDVS